MRGQRHLRALAVAAIALGLAGCGSGSTKTVTAPPAKTSASSYTPGLRALLMRSCRAFGGNPTVCGCALHHAEASIPITQIGRDELELKYGTPDERLATPLGRIIGHCSGQQAEEETTG